MSTVCYCGRPDCSVTSLARDACLTALRAERDALQKAADANMVLVEQLDQTLAAILDERDALKAQVEAERSEVVQLKEVLAAATARSDENFRSVLRLKARVEAARKVMEHALQNVKALTGGDERRMREWLDAMDEAAKK